MSPFRFISPPNLYPSLPPPRQIHLPSAEGEEASPRPPSWFPRLAGLCFLYWCFRLLEGAFLGNREPTRRLCASRLVDLLPTAVALLLVPIDASPGLLALVSVLASLHFWLRPSYRHLRKLRILGQHFEERRIDAPQSDHHHASAMGSLLRLVVGSAVLQLVVSSNGTNAASAASAGAKAAVAVAAAVQAATDGGGVAAAAPASINAGGGGGSGPEGSTDDDAIGGALLASYGGASACGLLLCLCLLYSSEAVAAAIKAGRAKQPASASAAASASASASAAAAAAAAAPAEVRQEMLSSSLATFASLVFTSLQGLAMLLVGEAIRVVLYDPAATAYTFYADSFRILFATALSASYALLLALPLAAGPGRAPDGAGGGCGSPWQLYPLSRPTALRLRCLLLLPMLAAAALPLAPSAMLAVESGLGALQALALYAERTDVLSRRDSDEGGRHSPPLPQSVPQSPAAPNSNSVGGHSSTREAGGPAQEAGAAAQEAGAAAQEEASLAQEVAAMAKEEAAIARAAAQEPQGAAVDGAAAAESGLLSGEEGGALPSTPPRGDVSGAAPAAASNGGGGGDLW